MKRCPKCGFLKSFRGFNKNANRSGGLNGWCKPCVKRADKNAIPRAAKWNKENKTLHLEHCRRNHLKTKFNLTDLDFFSLLIYQENKCLICEQRFSVTPHIDHDHKTGKVRGLLCHKCNLGIGMLGDNPTLIQNALDYLQ